jgi:hypothetical protein
VTAAVVTIHDVVVHQGERVDEFNGDGARYDSLSARSDSFGAYQRQHWAQAFPTFSWAGSAVYVAPAQREGSHLLQSRVKATNRVSQRRIYERCTP